MNFDWARKLTPFLTFFFFFCALSLQAKQENRFVMLDRGAVGDTLFALQNYKIGNMSDEEMEVYRSVCAERLPASIADKVDAVLYLDVEPRECHRRVLALRKNAAETVSGSFFVLLLSSLLFLARGSRCPPHVCKLSLTRLLLLCCFLCRASRWSTLRALTRAISTF